MGGSDASRGGAGGKLKVAVVTSYPADPGAPRGGVEAVSANLCDALSRFDDLEVHVVTLVPGESGGESESRGALRIHRVPDPGGFVLLKAIGQGRRAVCDRVRRLSPDVVHAHDTYGIMVTPLECPRVFTIHGFIYGDTRLNGRRLAGVRSLLWKQAETRAWARQPHIISISPYVRERLAGIARGVIHDIDNPISEEFFRVERKERKGVVFCAAIISPRKNTLGLVEAFARFLGRGHEGELRLAGTVVSQPYGERLQGRIRELGIEGKVRLLGRISMPRIREELGEASVFALVSYEENSPMGIEEAMAAGVPVVTSNRCGMPYMVRHGESGFLVNPDDPEDIAFRLGEIVGDDALRRRMGARSVEIARDRFHPEAVARRTRDVYREAVRGGRRHE